MDIKLVVKKIIDKLKFKRFEFYADTLCGIDIQVLPGTLRTHFDQDDAWWFHLASHHHAIYDIGCNIGYTALLALMKHSDKEILLVDANPLALEQAAVTLIRNGMGLRANYYPAFVGNTLDEEIKFYTIGTGAAGSMYASHAVSAAKSNSYLRVKTVTLDYLLDYYNFHPTLIKIDVEGAETLIMEGAKRLTKICSPTYFIEMHKTEHIGIESATQLILDWCSLMDYKAWYLKTSLVLEDTEAIKNRGKFHLLLQPSAKAFPNYLKDIKANSALPNLAM